MRHTLLALALLALAADAYAQTVLVDHLAVNVGVGTTQVGGTVTIDDTYTRVTLRLARQTDTTPSFWGPGVGVTLRSECSPNGGATWLEWLGFGSTGGIITRGNGQQMSESTVTSELCRGANRRLRATVGVTGGTLVSQITVEAQ